MGLRRVENGLGQAPEKTVKAMGTGQLLRRFTVSRAAAFPSLRMAARYFFKVEPAASMHEPATLSDAELLTAYIACKAEPGDPLYDRLAAEAERRARVYSGRPPHRSIGLSHQAVGECASVSPAV